LPDVDHGQEQQHEQGRDEGKLDHRLPLLSLPFVLPTPTDPAHLLAHHDSL